MEDILTKLKAKWKKAGILHIIYKNPLIQRKTNGYPKNILISKLFATLRFMS